MPGTEEFIQRTVHALGTENVSIWMKRLLFAAGILVLVIYYLWPGHFRGLATSQAMDQAQIGRAIVTGHGWRTKFVRPRAVGQLRENGKDATKRIWYDTYNAPLPPLVDAIALLPVKAHLVMNPRDPVYTGDRAIVVMSIFLFMCSMAVLFLIARRLFDTHLALLACGLVLLCDTIWRYSISGLPQMLLLLLFNATVYALVRAVENQYAGSSPRLPLIAAGVGFGLLALTHALTIWIFLPVLVVSFFFFRPDWRSVGFMLGAFAIVYLPWLIRNYLICGSPAGVAAYSILDGIGHPESGWMRRMDLDLNPVILGTLRIKIVGNLTAQAAHIFEYLGLSIVAVMFFVSLLHAFKRREAATLRWMILAMWGGAVLGMAVYGITEELGVVSNQLHLIFVPLMTCYGLAYLLVRWNRLGIEFPLARGGFIGLLYFLCALPMIFVWLGPRKSQVNWPPYYPGAISVLHNWMKPDEVTASDMPWAIAWYADRRSLWVPDTPQSFVEFGDYNTLGAPVNGLYLTPISGTDNTLRDIVKGEYREWAPIITRSHDLEHFPLTWYSVALGVEKECIFLSDHNRDQATSAK